MKWVGLKQAAHSLFGHTLHSWSLQSLMKSRMKCKLEADAANNILECIIGVPTDKSKIEEGHRVWQSQMNSYSNNIWSILYFNSKYMLRSVPDSPGCNLQRYCQSNREISYPCTLCNCSWGRSCIVWLSTLNRCYGWLWFFFLGELGIALLWCRAYK